MAGERLRRFAPWLIGLVGLLLYLPTLHHDFAWDDALVWTENPVTQQGVDGLAEIWTTPSYIPQRTIYRPVPQTIFAVLHEAAPGDPLPGHLLNILLYALVVVLVVRLFMCWMPGRAGPVVLAGLLFAVHPIHVEVVANIKSMDELLAAGFGLGAALLVHPGRQVGLVRVVLAGLLFALALLSKLSAVTLLPVLGLLWAVHHRASIRPLIRCGWDTVWQRRWEVGLVVLVALGGLALWQQQVSWLVSVAVLLALPIAEFRRRRSGLVALVVLAAFGTASQDIFWPLVLVLFLVVRLDLFDHLRARRMSPAVWAAVAMAVLVVVSGWAALIPMLVVLGLFWASRTRRVLNGRVPLAILVAMSIIVLFSEPTAFVLLILPVLLLLDRLPAKRARAARWHYSVFVAAVLAVTAWTYEAPRPPSVRWVGQGMASGAVQMIDVRATADGPVFLNRPYHNILVAVDDPVQRTATMARIQGICLKKLVWPAPLIHQYGAWQVRPASWRDADVWLSLALHLGLLVLFVLAARRGRVALVVGIGWYAFTIALYANVVALMPDTLAERFLFLPSVGGVLALVAGVVWAVEGMTGSVRARRLVPALLAIPLTVTFAVQSVDRSRDWADNFALAAGTVAHAPDNVAINAQYALEVDALRRSGRLSRIGLTSEEALEVSSRHYRRSVDLFPGFYGGLYDLGRLFIERGMVDSARHFMQRAADVRPDQVMPHYYLGFMDYDEAAYSSGRTAFETALRLDGRRNVLTESERTDAILFLARCHFNLGDLAAADALLREAWAARPDDARFLTLLGNMYYQSGRPAEALDVFLLLLPVSSDDPAWRNTVLILADELGERDRVEGLLDR